MPPSPLDDRQTPWPTTMAELAPSERFIVWSFRRWVRGLRDNDYSHWSLVSDEFTRQLGEVDGQEALSGFARLVMGLQRHARRPVRVHWPCCPGLGVDEVLIVCLVASCQHHESRFAKRLAEWVVKCGGASELIMACKYLALIMHRRSLDLPMRTGTTAMKFKMPPAKLSGATMH